MLYLLSLILSPLWAFPVLNASFVRSKGRPYKKWLLIGITLPIISTFIVMFLPYLSETEIKIT